MRRDAITEYSGAVWNLEENQYDKLFITEISKYLAINRAMEKASEINDILKRKVYDIGDVHAYKRTVIKEYYDWEDDNDA